MLVTSCGSPCVGPISAAPTKPAVLVLPPPMGCEPVSTSSTYTPGARYSGILASLLLELRLREQVDDVDGAPVVEPHGHDRRRRGRRRGLEVELGDPRDAVDAVPAGRVGDGTGREG